MNPETYSTENSFVKCLLCKETYKDARLLPCVHSFCIGCLYSNTESNTSNGLQPQCPLCKKEFKLTDEGLKGLRKDPLLEKLAIVKTITSSKSPDIYCEEYHEDVTGDGLSVLQKVECYCITCSQYLCRSCGTGHSTNRLSRSHGLVNFGSSQEEVFEHFRNSSSPSSCMEHKEPTILYCVSCRCLVCAMCVSSLTDRHVQHQRLPVTQAAEGLRGELRGFIAGASDMASSTGTGIQKIRNEVFESTRKSEDCERTISSAIDELKRLVDAAGRKLLGELRQLKQRRLDERQTALVHLRHRLNSIEHFTMYCTGMDETASPYDLCEVSETLDNRFDELRADHVLPKDAKSDEFEIFLERNKEVFSSEENILGKLKEMMKNSNQNTVECNDSSHFLNLPRTEESIDENATRHFPFGHERSEELREFLDLIFDTKVSSESSTHRTAKLDERASTSKTPTLNKVSRSCTRSFLSTTDSRINALTGETVIEGCYDHDHDHDHSADTSTKSGGKVSTSVERGERQLNEREQDSIIVYVRSEFNGNFNEIKDIKNQEQRTVVTDTASAITTKSKPNKRSVSTDPVETITIDDDSESSDNDNTIKSDVKTTETVAPDGVKIRSLDKLFEAELISGSQPETNCTSNVFNIGNFSEGNSSDDDDDDDLTGEISSASSLDLIEYLRSPSVGKLKPRRKNFDRIPSSTEEESKRRDDIKTEEVLRFSNFKAVSSVLDGDPSASDAAKSIKGEGEWNSANRNDEIASGSAFGFINQEDDVGDEFVKRLLNTGSTTVQDYLDVKTQAHQTEQRGRKRKRKRSSKDHKEKRQARRTLELVHKLSGKTSEIYGVAHLQDILYILRKKSVCTYQAQHPYSLLKTVPLKSISTPNDIAACAKHAAVYITDFANYHNDPQRHSIWRVSADKLEAEPTRWLTGIVEPYTVSVTRDGKVVLLSLRPEESSIEVRDHDARVVVLIPLPKEMVGAEHAVETSTGSFVVCHATTGHPNWTLSEVDRKGEIVRRLNRDCVLLDEPKHLAVDIDDRVFVANWKRGEVVVLPGGLDWADRGGVFKEGGTKDRPGRLCYVQDSNLLVVINHMRQSRVYLHNPNLMPVRS